MKAKRLLSVLMREPLGYRIVRQTGSHRILISPGRPRLSFAYHDRATVAPHAVRSVLVHDIGLDEHEALELL